jgi:hypothetical protein
VSRSSRRHRGSYPAGHRALESFLVGLVMYAVAFAVSWVSAALTLVLCGLMALYYAFD